jgi:hypothetical protein
MLPKILPDRAYTHSESPTGYTFGWIVDFLLIFIPYGKQKETEL